MPGYGHNINNQALYLYQSHLQLVADRKEVEIFVEEIRDHYNNTDRYEPGEGDRQVKRFYRSFIERRHIPLLGCEKYHLEQK